MLQPSMKNLKHIVLNIHVVACGDVDPLFGIPSEFEKMGANNIIETVTIRVFIPSIYRRGDDWGRLDEVLTTTLGWVSPKRVSLAIEINNYYDEIDNELEVALRKLPETEFRRLSSSNSISFDFEVKKYNIPISISHLSSMTFSDNCGLLTTVQ